MVSSRPDPAKAKAKEMGSMPIWVASTKGLVPMPKKAAASVLAACEEGRWIGPAHVATSAIASQP
jgi:hypothetical protein